MAFSMHVNMNRCTGCGNCVVSCPVNALELYTLDPVTKEKIYRVVNGKSISLDVNMELCAGCGVCVKGLPVPGHHPVRQGRDGSSRTHLRRCQS